MGNEMNELAVESVNGTVNRTAQTNRTADNRIEDPVDVGLGLTDHSEDLAGRRLLLSDSLRSPFRCSSSLNRRTFSMAITAWSAQVSTNWICQRLSSRVGKPQPLSRRTAR